MDPFTEFTQKSTLLTSLRVRSLRSDATPLAFVVPLALPETSPENVPCTWAFASGLPRVVDHSHRRGSAVPRPLRGYAGRDVLYRGVPTRRFAAARKKRLNVGPIRR